ncbi:MAG: DNA primase [Rhodospirillales bacterium]|nr:DNA primase [Rhodospirillales bacterium]
MAFPPQFLDEIRTRVPLEGVIGKRVRLMRRGRELLGLCPFHNEKTPSFTVNEDKGFFHCFGCGAHGDVIGFVMRDEGLSFPEAVERLAGDAGLALPARDPRTEAREKQRHSLFGVVEAAAKWFEAELKGPRGGAARDYLEARGVDEAAREQFRLGFASNSRSALRTALEKDGITEAMMLEAGLVIAPDDGRAPYDRFRGRVIFPICDRRGRVVAFGGRALGDGQPKYLNSPETPLFAKGSLLYGQHLAAPAARKTGQVIAVEGYMDVIALHQAGIAQAVAPLGTALTEHQLEALWRLAADPVLCFDGDEAGARAAARVVDRVLPLINAGRSLRFALLPPGQDPDSMLRDGHGRQAMTEIVDAAIPLSAQLWKATAAGRVLDTPEARARVGKQLKDQVQRIPDRDLQNRYLFEEFWPRLRALAKAQWPGNRAAPVIAEVPLSRGEALGSGMHGTAQPRERTLLQTLLDYPALIVEQQEALARIRLETPRFTALMDAMIEWAETGPEPDSALLRDALARQGLDDAVEELAGADTHYLNRAASLADARNTLAHALELQRLRLELPPTLSEAEKALAEEPSEENWERLQEAIRRKQDMERVAQELPDEAGRSRTGGT